MALALIRPLSLTFLLLLSLLPLLQLSDGLNDAQKILTSFKDLSNRKLLMDNGLEAKEAVFKIHVNKKETRKENEEGWELRAAPLGPDPLHHHGSDPKKPRTP